MLCYGDSNTYPPAGGTPQNIRYFKDSDFQKKEVTLGSGNVIGTNG